MSAITLVAAHDRPALRAVAREPIALPSASAEEPPDDAGELVPSPAMPDLTRGDEPEIAVALPAPPDDAVRLVEARGAPVPLRAQHEAVVAQCLDHLALSGRHRATRRLDERASEEQSILEVTDALVVCPRFLTSMLAWWRASADSPDPWKIWAPTFVLGCLEGSDQGEALVWLAASLDEGDTTAMGAFAEALALAPSPEAPGWAADLARSDHPAARAVGVEASSLLGLLGPEQIAAALAPASPRPARWAGLRAAARLPSDTPLTVPIAAILDGDHDAELLWLATRALALRGNPLGYDAVRHRPAFADRLGARLFDVLALFGDAGDAPLARRAASRLGPTRAVLRGLARYGHPGAAPILLRALADEDSAEHAADALEWLFGEPLDPDHDGKSAPRPIDPAGDRTSPARWRAHLARAPIDDEARLRFGVPYRPGLVEAAFSRARISRLTLAFLADEAAVRAGIASAPRALFRWSPEGDAELPAFFAAARREDAAFTSDPWRSIIRQRHAWRS